MSQFPVNTQRIDPYKNFKFRLKSSGQYVAGVSKVSALKRTSEVVAHRPGGAAPSATASLERTSFEPITLEQGVTESREFHEWASLARNFKAGFGSDASRAGVRKDLYLELHNAAGQVVLAYRIYRCWVSEYQAMPELDATAHSIVFAHLKLEHEGWEQDASVTEPTVTR